jgi:hypothetical protein
VVTSSNDLDWRLTVKFESKTRAHGVFSALMTHASATLVANRLKDGFVAQHDAEWLRIYAASADALRRGQTTVADVIEREGLQAEVQAERRIGEKAGWESVELPPLPERDASLVIEHHGKGPWGSNLDPNRIQIHFELDSKRSAQAFAKELAADGYDVRQAGGFVFIFADDSGTARELGNALKKRAPVNAQLFFEGEGRTFFI